MLAEVLHECRRAIWPPTDRLRALRDRTGDTSLVSLARIGFGLLLLNEAQLATEQFREVGFFGSYFHQPFLPEALVPSEGAYEAVLAAQWIAAALVLVGRWARPALLAAAGLLLYTMLCDRLWFHHYRHTMAAFCTLLAFTPCDRRFVLGKAADATPGPLWAQHAMKAQVSVMYLASAGSKLFDADWRGGLMMRGMIAGFARLVQQRGVPPEVLRAVETPLGASLLAKGAIFTELALAGLLWWPRTRRPALWVGLFFHLIISLMTPVKLFTMEMLLVYLLFVTPDAGARVVRFDPRRHQAIANLVESLDWLQRFTLEPQKDAEAFTVVDRDGQELNGPRAVACVFGALPVLFPAWPVVTAAAALTRRRAR